MADEGKADRPQPGNGGWTPHLWVIGVPFIGVAVAYALWFAFMALLRLPDWLARMTR